MSPFSRRLQRGGETNQAKLSLAHGQQVTLANVGRAGAASVGAANFNATQTIISGNQVYTTTQTIRNAIFTGNVEVRGGNVTFEFCAFTFAPPSGGTQ